MMMMMMTMIIIIIIIRTAFLLCVTFSSSVWMSTSFPVLWLSGEHNFRSKQNVKKLGVKCYEMLRTFLFVLMILSPVLREAHFSA